MRGHGARAPRGDRRLKVGLDYLPATSHFPGVGRYARELVRALVRLPDCPELALFDVGGAERVVPKAALGLSGPEVTVKQVRWLRLDLPRRAVGALSALGVGADRMLGGVDLFHRVLASGPPVARALQVLVVSELPPDAHAAAEAETRMRAELERVDHALVMSRHAERELIERFGLDAERVHRVPVGCDHWSRELPCPAPREDPPVLLALGALRPERRPLDVLAGFEALLGSVPSARLVFAGRAGAAADALRERLAASPAREQVRCIEPIEDELPALVAGASVLVHLSAGEETAVTPLEAFGFGTPVVASRLGAFEEDLGDEATLLADAELEPARLARAFEAAIESARDAGACARRRAVAGGFTWARNAAATVEVWRRVLERTRG